MYTATMDHDRLSERVKAWPGLKKTSIKKWLSEGTGMEMGVDKLQGSVAVCYNVELLY